ncbi:iron ABC transporter permease [Pelagibius sp. CAU 1746]|uniref:FecCD family ABC transporter permease n=1 Tax=Pelagibius sp. CAU 1746 TaxID=3140370 RepID=UPI00325A49A1
MSSLSVNDSGRRGRAGSFVLTLAVLGTGLAAGLIGRFDVAPWDVFRIALSPILPLDADWEPITEAVILQIRLPRVLAALLAGGALALSGACYQGIFRNPLVSPFILGVSSGAGFGAALAILLSASALVIQGSAFGFGLVAVVTSMLLARLYRRAPALILILSGVIVGSVFSALLALLKYTADPDDKLPVIEFWLMGSLSGVSFRDMLGLAVCVGPGAAALLLMRWRLNVLSMGEEQARALGVDVVRLRSIMLAIATLLAASAVSVCGVVGWVGLVAPHMARLLVGADHRHMMPVSFALGGCLLTVVDTLARSLGQAEIPLGIVTALVGAPLFAVLLRRGTREWT